MINILYGFNLAFDRSPMQRACIVRLREIFQNFSLTPRFSAGILAAHDVVNRFNGL
jgi:hypothetical protein